MDDSSIRERLRTVGILAALSDEDLDRLAGSLKWTRASRDEAIVSHLDRTDSVYFIISGTCRVKLTAASGRGVALRRMSAGAHFGEIAAITAAPRTVDVIAETDCVLAECPRDAFTGLMQTNAAFAQAVAAALARTVVSLTERVFEFAALEVRYRLYAELLRLAKTSEATPEGALIRDMPTHETLAVSIGSQREAVTREFAILTAEGLVRQDKRTLLIPDVEALRALIQRRTGVAVSHLVDWPL
jgi:CRP-like cAMP-binding protein